MSNNTSRTITNNANLPRPMYNALAADTYVGGGDISATRLIGPPRIVTLRKYHEPEIKEDASNRIWSLLGSATHRMLELSAGEGIRVEERQSYRFKGINIKDAGDWYWDVTAQPDVLEGTVLSDYKVTSVWSVLHGEKPEWERQLNIQAALHRLNGDDITEAFIIAILRDWQVSKARFERDYPRVAVMKISIPLWPQAEAVEYIERRVRVHQKAQLDYEESGQNPDVLPLCTETERWYRGGGFAVKKKNTKTGVENKKADRVFDNKTDALQFITDNPLDKAIGPKGRTSPAKDKVYFIEERKGENKRCIDYCDVAEFCPFGRQVHAELKAAQTEKALVNENDEAED